MANFLSYFILQVDDEDNEKIVSKIDKNLTNMKLDAPAPVAYDNIIVGADGIGYVWTFRGNKKFIFNLYICFYLHLSTIPLFSFFFYIFFSSASFLRFFFIFDN